MRSCEIMQQDFNQNWDLLLTKIERRARTPGLATTSGPPFNTAYDPIPLQAFEEEERRLGLTFPLLLKRLYTEVGNGGFGPGEGLLSLIPLSVSDHPISYFYINFRAIRNRKGAEWADGVLPFNHWGDLILSCVDLTNSCEDPPVVRFEPNMPKSATFANLKGWPFLGAGLIPERENLSMWFEAWIKGEEMFHRPYVD